MDHFPRFRRRKDVPSPTIITAALPNKTTTTPPSGDLQPAAPARPVQKLSPFRVFHRSSGKRARDSPPASLPHSPAAAAVPGPDGGIDRPVSPLSLRTDPAREDDAKAARALKIPAFLELSQQEIENKFGDLVWLERDRMAQAVTNNSPDFRWARVKGPHLKTLDRYVNIQPWQNHRVKLQVPDGHVDYINASPITLTPSPRPANDSRPGEARESDRYIAMQGPKASSIDHVWRMVVEQLESPGVIVMLTETHEGHMEKCSPYFPRHKEDPPLEINERDEFGDGFRATVRCEGIEETPAGDAIELRKLVVRIHARGGSKPQPAAADSSSSLDIPVLTPGASTEKDLDLDVHMKSPGLVAADQPVPEVVITEAPTQPEESVVEQEEERIVWHFLYKKWPDFGVPALADLESFFTLMRLSREKNAGPHNPRIVHCSAGVGRSGTFIALEHLIRELDAGVLEHYDERAATPGGRRSADERSFRASPSTATSSGAFDEVTKRGGEASPATTVIEEEGEDLIFATVNQLREQRRNMVQAEAQYLFIYQVLRKLWQDKYGSGGGEGGEPAAKRLEVDPFVET
ncbi:protein-tyrosine phosphatase-like protein [Podospora aff. communis PSN243]|uniref:Protein-tyrosine phosphatase-like protein n=1 Tax=Podospora aff. communis PSN243 TaxID=3040156 RepID=A0AAV9G8S8_9PEZI|nr:protein-tyrosine phosphatase-like protein [Podospora aff. communis PSN243]